MPAPITRLEFHFPAGTKLRHGRCAACGCTDTKACPGGCSWVDRAHHVCSACALLALASVDLSEPTEISRVSAAEGDFVAVCVPLKKTKARKRR